MECVPAASEVVVNVATPLAFSCAVPRLVVPSRNVDGAGRHIGARLRRYCRGKRHALTVGNLGRGSRERCCRGHRALRDHDTYRVRDRAGVLAVSAIGSRDRLRAGRQGGGTKRRHPTRVQSSLYPESSCHPGM